MCAVETEVSRCVESSRLLLHRFIQRCKKKKREHRVNASAQNE